MKYIQNVQVQLTGRARHYAAAARAAVVDTEGTYTTVAHFLCGENPWGFHNDMRFTTPPLHVRQGLRLVAAAEAALATNGKWIVLSNEDYEVLVSAAFNPARHPAELKMPAELARELIPVFDAIESAVEELPK